MRGAVIEDQTIMREYLAGLLCNHCGITEIVLASSMAEVHAKADELGKVRLTLFDIDLGDGSTIDWAIKSAEQGRGGAMIATSSIPGSFPFKKLQSAGISLVHKNDGAADLITVIQQTLGGATVMSRGVSAVLAEGRRDPNSPNRLLGDKEIRVLGYLGQRFSNSEIAELLACSEATVADHRKRIMRKLDLHSIEQVIEYAIRHGVIYDSEAASARQRLKSSGA